MKRLMIILLLLILLLISGCESVKLDGFSIGATYLNTDLTTTTIFGDKQNTKVEGLMPIGLLNFKFE